MSFRKLSYVWMLIVVIWHCTQTCYAQNPDTRKGWDLRNHGYDSAMSFVVRYNQSLSVLIGVATSDEKLVEEIKQIIRELDWRGFENIGLVLHDQLQSSKENGETHDIFFYQDGYPLASITKRNGVWYYISLKDDKPNEIIDLRNETKSYPVTLIRTKIKTIFKNQD